MIFLCQQQYHSISIWVQLTECHQSWYLDLFVENWLFYTATSWTRGLVQSQGPLKTQFSSFSANGRIKFKVQLCNCWKIWNHLNLPDLLENSPQIYECYCSLRTFFCKEHCDWIIFFQVPRFKFSHCNTYFLVRFLSNGCDWFFE